MNKNFLFKSELIIYWDYYLNQQMNLNLKPAIEYFEKSFELLKEQTV